MPDELDLLRDSRELQQLLTHYARLGAEDRESWRDRLGQLDGVTARDLARLHGELIAFGWVEQNTGATGGCYRVTAAGLRAVKLLRAEGRSAEAVEAA